MRLVLASASPRRLELLAALGHEVIVRPAHVDERSLPGEAPAALVTRLAAAKCVAIDGAGEVVVAADTTVVLDALALEKPADDADAARMLRALSGRTHEVLTAFQVARGAAAAAGLVRTRVTFRALGDDEIRAYVASGEPRDKAGAYGIQGRGGALVDTVEGSYTNVVGLPVREVLDAIERLLGAPR